MKSENTTGGRITRQRQGLTRLVSMLNIGQGIEVDGRELIISEAEVVPEAFMANLKDTMRRASTEGAAAAPVGDHLAIQCIDCLAVRRRQLEKERVFKVVAQSMLIVKKWRARGDFILPCSGDDRYVNVHNLVPFSIFPLPIPARVALMAGATRMLCFLNVSEVLRIFDKAGWRTIRTPEEYAAEMEANDLPEAPIAKIKKGRLSISIRLP